MKKWHVLFIAIALTACTDYVNQIEDEREDWRNAQELAALSSNSSSSSAILSSESLEGSSSSDAKSCSSEKTTSSSSEKNASSSSSAKSNGSSSSSENAALIDVNDPPLVRDTMFSIDENLANGSFVGKIIAFDPDTILAYCTLFYAIIESDVPFILDSNIIKVGDSSRLDYEVDPVFTFHVRVCDRELCDTALVVVNLNDVNEMMSSSSSGKASWAYLNSAISYGEMTDDRDGQVYKTIVIGEQTWMAENLNYETENSYCYNDSTKYCDKYGRLYTWEAAKKACPEAWDLPSKEEFNSLVIAIGGENVGGAQWSAGNKLKSVSGWNNGGNGTDDYGFSAIPAGSGTASGNYNYVGEDANFYASDDNNDYSYTYGMSLSYRENTAKLGVIFKTLAISVRCKKNGLFSSSSSEIQSSSSKESWAYLNPAISYGEMTDDRDGQIYKTVVIGEQTWMAENLRYGKKVSNGSEIKDDAIVAYFCYDGDTIKCMKYGGLYSWSEMMALPYNCNNINCSDLIDGDGIHQGICPQDWHVPSLTEWDVLFTTVGGQSVAGKALKSSENWINNGDGLNTFGFSAIPAGYVSADGGKYFSEMSEAAFWTANIYSSYQAFYISFGYSGNGSHLTTYRGKVIGQSVRCIKNGSQMSNSSSSVSSSSSKASWAYLNPSYSYGEMTDDRDGQVYKTVEIGEQTWMAENLNYETARSFCKNSELYGRLYLWSAAMDSAGLWSTNGKGCGYDVTCATTYPVRGVCPSGWHLPSTGDWNNLIAAVGGQYATVDRLKSTSGWSDGSGNGVDAVSFSAIPAGRWDGSVEGVGEYAYFWSSTMTSGSRNAYRMYVGENNVIAQMNYADMGYGYSVRCVKD